MAESHFRSSRCSVLRRAGYAQQLPITKYDIDQVPAQWNGMEARLTIDADYPEGNSPAAKTLQRWLLRTVYRQGFSRTNPHGQATDGTRGG